MKKETLEEFMQYINRGIEGEMLTAEKAKEALSTLGFTLGEIKQKQDTLEFVRDVELDFNQ